MSVSELEPTFDVSITVRVDGDDYPPTATASVEHVLRATLESLIASRLIRSFELEVRT